MQNGSKSGLFRKLKMQHFVVLSHPCTTYKCSQFPWSYAIVHHTELHKDAFWQNLVYWQFGIIKHTKKQMFVVIFLKTPNQLVNFGDNFTDKFGTIWIKIWRTIKWTISRTILLNIFGTMLWKILKENFMKCVEQFCIICQ